MTTRRLLLALAGIIDSLKPSRRCLPLRHDWDDEHSVPASCTRCGRTGWPLAALHDVFDTSD